MSSSPLYPSAQTWLHILFGDNEGGGHLAGQGFDGKSEYPSYWAFSRIESAIVLAQLQRLNRGMEISPGVFDELVDGILLRIVIRQSTGGLLEIETAFPLRGNGVFRNIEGQRVSRPLLPQDRRK